MEVHIIDTNISNTFWILLHKNSLPQKLWNIFIWYARNSNTSQILICWNSDTCDKKEIMIHQNSNM